MTIITDRFYKGIPAKTLSNESLEVTLIPSHGGKIQSIKFLGKEYLLQNSDSVFVRSAYSSCFEDGDFSGFDDMFPTISECRYPGGPWDGVQLPDHGEVWTLPFSCEAQEESLALSTHGVRLPYTFTKRVALSGGSILLDYSAQNHSPFAMRYIWAAHPLFVLEEGTRLDLPFAREIINVFGGNKYLGAFSEHHPWPVSKDGRDLRLLSPSEQCCNKYYVWNALEANESNILYPNGDRISLAGDVRQVPYLGIWQDEMGYAKRPSACIAPEPCTGAFDAPDLADKFGKYAEIMPNECVSWRLTIEFRNIKIAGGND